jgi:hypothetical protein
MDAPVESCGNGLDDDCDGVVDGWQTVDVSQAGTTDAKSAHAVTLPNGDIAVLWWEAPTVFGRIVRADGTLSSRVQPSASLASGEGKSSNGVMALAASDDALISAWYEFNPTDAGMSVVLASLDRTTLVSSLPGAGVVRIPLLQLGSYVAVGLDFASGVATLASIDGQTNALAYRAYDWPLATTSLPRALQPTLFAPAARPQLAPAGGGNFWINYLHTSFASVSAAPFLTCRIDANATLTCPSTSTPGVMPAVVPTHPGPGFESQTYFISIAPDGGNVGLAQLTCDGGGCYGPVGLPFPDAHRTELQATPVGLGSVALLAWQEGAAPNFVYRYAFTDGGPSLPQPGELPQPLELGGGAHGIVYDTFNTDAGRSIVALRRWCE